LLLSQRVNENEQTLTQEEYKNVTAVLDTAKKNCSKIPVSILDYLSNIKQISITFLNDEMASIVKAKRLDRQLFRYMSSQAMNEFEKRYIVEIQEGKLDTPDSVKNLKPQCWMNLDSVIF